MNEASRIPDLNRRCRLGRAAPAAHRPCGRGPDRLVHRAPTRTSSISGRTSSQPAFEAANPGVTLNLVDAGDNAGNIAIGERALAALQNNADPQADYFESYDPRLPAGGIEAGLFVNMKEAGLSNWGKINPLAIDTDFSVPYRGSQVLLAYDTTKLDPADAPKTFEDLVAWIKANPGHVHLQPPRQGRLRRQLRPPRHLRGERQGPGEVHRRQLHPRGRREGADPGLGDPRRPRAVAVRRGRLHLGQHPVDPAPRPVGGHHDPGLVRPGDPGDQPGRPARDHRPRAAARPGAARRLLAQRGACERRQQGRGAEARRLRPDRGDAERRPDRARRLPGRLLGLRQPGAAREVRRRHPDDHPDLPGRRLGGRGQRRLVPQRRPERGPRTPRDTRPGGRHRRETARAGGRSASCSSRPRCSSSAGWSSGRSSRRSSAPSGCRCRTADGTSRSRPTPSSSPTATA